MQKLLFLIGVILSFTAAAQAPLAHPATRQTTPASYRSKTLPLPGNIYNTLHDSCTQLDIVFITGKGGSMSLDGRNVKYFTSFVSTKPVEKKPNATQDGTIMWQIDGKAYLMGNLYFTGDSSGYIAFDRNSKEYVNALTPDGAGFLKTRGGK